MQGIVRSLLRYGPQIHTTLRAPGVHDWSFADAGFAEIRRLGIVAVLADNSMTREDYHSFERGKELRRHCVMGNDWYVTNEQRPARRRGGALVVDAKGRRHATAPGWRTGARLHLVFADRPGGLEPCAARAARRREPAGGLYDLDRNIRTVGRAYRRLIETWKPVLKAESHCPRLPVTG